MLAATPWPPTSIQQPEQSDARNLISRHAWTLSFLITSLFHLLLYILWRFLMHKLISALLHATLIHVALNQHSTPINSLGKHSQLFPLFSESDIALLSENEHSGAQKKNTQLQDVHLWWIPPPEKHSSGSQWTHAATLPDNRTSASSCLRARTGRIESRQYGRSLQNIFIGWGQKNYMDILTHLLHFLLF